MNKDVMKELNRQYNMELSSAYLYRGMQEWLQQHGFHGSAHWMSVQVQEEMAHADGLRKFIQFAKGNLELKAIEAAPTEYSSILDLFEKALAHEELITSSFNKIYELAGSKKEHAVQIFLNWYIMEQLEEEDNEQNHVQAFKACGKDICALMAYDAYLGKREFHAPEIPYLG